MLANGGTPVTNVKKNAAPLQVLARRGGQWVDTGILRGPKVNGRGTVKRIASPAANAILTVTR